MLNRELGGKYNLLVLWVQVVLGSLEGLQDIIRDLAHSDKMGSVAGYWLEPISWFQAVIILSPKTSWQRFPGNCESSTTLNRIKQYVPTSYV